MADFLRCISPSTDSAISKALSGETGKEVIKDRRQPAPVIEPIYSTVGRREVSASCSLDNTKLDRLSTLLPTAFPVKGERKVLLCRWKVILSSLNVLQLFFPRIDLRRGGGKETFEEWANI